MSIPGGFEEKRKHERYKFCEEVEFCIKRIEPQTMRKNHPEIQRKAMTDNISMGGIQIVDENPLDPGEILRICFQKKDPVRCEVFGKVKWCLFDEKINKYRAGIEFIYIKSTLKELVERISAN